MALAHRRRRGAFLVALAATLAFAAPASANHLTTYPHDANTFDVSAEGWTDAVHDCVLIVIPSAVCTTDNEHSEAVGNPPGSLHSWYTTVANIGGLGVGTAAWRSPEFTIDSTLVPTPVAGTINVEKLFEARGALLDVGGTGNTTVFLVDKADEANPDTILEEADFPAATAADPWQSASKAVSETLLVPGTRTTW